MSMAGHENISMWGMRIEAVIAATDQCCVDRVVVLESTPSTMDAAAAYAQSTPGLLVLASRQTNGRGQLGRDWHDGDRKTLPCTFVIDAGETPAPMLAAIVGCAVHETIVRHAPPSTVLIKWPNDIVVRDQSLGDDRKIAGILIEQRALVASIGIGINCTQTHADWGDDLRAHAVSLGELGAQVARLDLLCTLIERLSHWFGARDRAEIRAYWTRHDAMVGTTRTFIYDHKRFVATVEHIDPLESITLRTNTGTLLLPIAQTRHVRAQERL